MSWTFAAEFDSAHRAALERGKPLLYIAPPAGWALRPLFLQLPPGSGPGVQTLVLAPDVTTALEILSEVATFEPLAPAHVVTGLARTARLTAAGVVRTLIATPSDAMQLAARSALPTAALARVVLCWPETLARDGTAGTLDPLLAECGEAQRVIVTTEERAITDLVERHARRAPAVTAAQLPDSPGGPARYAVVGGAAMGAVVRAALDIANPGTAFVWDPSSAHEARWHEFRGAPGVRVSADPSGEPADLAIATTVPSSDAFQALKSVARDLLVLVRPLQLPYLRRLADPLSGVRLSTEVDHARDWRSQLRQRVRDRIETKGHEANLLALAPLLDEFDPALVAAALLELPAEGAAAAGAAPEVPMWVHLHLSVGRRDNVRPGDIVGALLNAAGLAKEDVGRVDVRESFTVVEVRAAAGERARRALHGITLRGHAVAARFDQR